MKKIAFAKSVFTASLVAACAWGLAGCAAGSGNTSETSYTGGVAATVNGVEIAEDDVTAMIESQRAQASLDDEDSWGSYLAQIGSTPSSIREQFIDGFISQEIVRQFASECDVNVEDSEVDSYVEKMKSNYSSDEDWRSALSQSGLIEDEYRENIKFSLQYQGLENHFTTEEPSAENMLTYAKMYASSYDGAKKSSHILFDASDEATAQSVLDQINAGTLDFAEAAAQYSKDSSASGGGNVGWDKLTTFVDEYQDALDALEVGQVSGLVTSDYGIHIIKCTAEFTAPEELTDVNQLPEEFVERIKSMAASAESSQAISDWIDEKREASDVVINDMPENVPYNVDMSKYETSDESSDAATADGDASDASDQAGAGDADATAENVDADASESSSDANAADGAGSDASADGASDADADASAEASSGDSTASA